MLVWKIDVFDDKKQSTFEIPATEVSSDDMRQLMRYFVAKSLTFKEIAGRVWSKKFGKLDLLEVAEQDEGRTLACGHGLINATAREFWKP